VELLGRVRRASVALEKCDRSNRARNRIENAPISKKRVRFANPIQTHLENVRIEQNRWCEINIPLEPTTKTTTLVTNSVRSTGIRVLQLNMRRSQIVSSKVRQLAFDKRPALTGTIRQEAR